MHTNRYYVYSASESQWLGADAQPMYQPMRQPVDISLADRLEIKRQQALRWLGNRWVLSKANQVSRKTA